ncbi:MAG TPA: hypothetical protein VG736_07865 [Vicinamibacterales bacterium]|jgi:hypothetical protein|nr:hypothetical protein [Vicinamibacterales bacterium]
MTDDTTQAPKDLIGFLDFYLVKKAPFQIPDGAKEWIVKWGPWISVVILILLLPALLFALGISAFFLPFAGVAAPGLAFAWLFLVVELGLIVASLPGLFARKMSGWKLAFYARLASIVYGLLSYAIIGAIVGGLISLYVLFQIREKYS